MPAYRELKVWNMGMELVSDVYRVVSALPGHERFGLKDQLRRAAISIPTNIAEGHARDTTKDFLRFLAIAKGSVAEVETLLELAVRLGYINREQVRPSWSKTTQIGRMLTAFQSRLRHKAATGQSMPPERPPS